MYTVWAVATSQLVARSSCHTVMPLHGQLVTGQLVTGQLITYACYVQQPCGCPYSLTKKNGSVPGYQFVSLPRMQKEAESVERFVLWWFTSPLPKVFGSWRISGSWRGAAHGQHTTPRSQTPPWSSGISTSGTLFMEAASWTACSWRSQSMHSNDKSSRCQRSQPITCAHVELCAPPFGAL